LEENKQEVRERTNKTRRYYNKKKLIKNRMIMTINDDVHDGLALN
jgi:hypothetical protein